MKIFHKGKLSNSDVIQWLQDMRGHPYVPESGFDVTTVFRVKSHDHDDYYFAGVNVENPDHRQSTHGEEACIAAMVTSLGKNAEIVEGWVMGAPHDLIPGDQDPLAQNKVSCCGKCRQQIAGFADEAVKIHSVSLNGDLETHTVGMLLPLSFTFRQFAPEILEDKNKPVQGSAPTLNAVKNKLIRKGESLTDSEIFSWLTSLESADFASKISQSVILKLTNGAYVAGTKIEEAAFVSMNPLQSALAIANAEFGVCEVSHVWAYSKGRGGKELKKDEIQALSLAGIQTLSQFVNGNNISISMFKENGTASKIELHKTATYAPTFKKPFIEP